MATYPIQVHENCAVYWGFLEEIADEVVDEERERKRSIVRERLKIVKEEIL